ncbi:pickpocket protein 28 isoform X2 [Cephus cinctus]|uniref:Pickpocket protein 28 isoform X2 n=1 Tax=Cephus cinctus TaxID=211228 RepID=A0AAJ7RJ90_CEPCN|nr:pickpocket protein 28 isoform X2 [Cephus cinctus]
MYNTGRNIHKNGNWQFRQSERPKKFGRPIMRNGKLDFRNYCENTSLHGFRYIIMSKSSICEKLIWLVICCSGFAFSVFMMLRVWQRFLITPTVTTIDTTTSPIWNLPFPAVTICNFNKVYQPHAEVLANELMKYGFNQTEIDNFFISLPKLIRSEDVANDYAPVMRTLAHLNIPTEELMLKLMQPCSKLLVRCAWLGQIYDCKKLFKTAKSIEGYCCSFNYHATISLESSHADYDPSTVIKSSVNASKSITKENNENLINYQDEFEWLPGKEEVLMAPGAGRDVGLAVALNVETKYYRGSIRPYVGASILIHRPFDYAEVDLQSTVVEDDTELAIILSGTIVESVKSVRDLTLERRNCWYSDEMKLRITNRYSFESCVTECKLNYIIKLCECAPFYYPKIYDKVRTCGLMDSTCIWTYQRMLSTLHTIGTTHSTNNSSYADCSCLPQCSGESYTFNTEHAKLMDVQYDSANFRDMVMRNHSMVFVNFRDITCLKYRTQSLMSWDDVLASFGGIFGLCLGGSFISVVELLYYIVKRIFYESSRELKSQRKQEIVTTDIITRSRRRPVVSTSPYWSNRTFVKKDFDGEINSVALHDIKRYKRDVRRNVLTARKQW